MVDNLNFLVGKGGLIKSSTVNTRPEQQLQADHAQHGHLRHSIAGNHVFHVILLSVGGVIYIPHTLVPLKSLGLDSQRVKKLVFSSMLILCTMLIKLV